MKYNIQNKIPYEGSVTLTIKSKSGNDFILRGYNEALPGLSEVFALSLLGYDVSSRIPTYLDFGAYADTTFISRLTNKVLLTGKHYEIDEDGFFYLVVDALVTDYLLNSISIPSGSQYYIFLTSVSGTQLTKLALIDNNGLPIVEGSGGSSGTSVSSLVGSGKNLMITWKLKLCNIEHSEIDDDDREG